MRVLVTAASRHDATREIAEAIAAGITKSGVDAEIRPIEDVQSLDGYDAAVIGSAIYMGRWLKPARRFIEANAAELTAIPVWLFSSGPLGPPEHLVPEAGSTDTPEMIKLTGAREHRVFAGRLEKQRLGLAERAAVAAVHAPEQDSREWSAIEAFAEQIVADLSAARVSGP